MRRDEALAWATTKLPAETARLEAMWLLEKAGQCTRIQVLSHPEVLLTDEQDASFKSLVEARASGMPLAYVTGHCEFFSLDLKVSPEVLIPRADTECLIEYILESSASAAAQRCLDLGTGSGAIAIAVAHSQPHWEVIATERSVAALQVAKENAKQHQLDNIHFYAGDWFAALPEGVECFDWIISNPPYIDPDDSDIAEDVKQYEPAEALFSENEGLLDLQNIIQQAIPYLAEQGTLVLEHGWRQSASVRELCQQAGLSATTTYPDLAGRGRFCVAQRV